MSLFTNTRIVISLALIGWWQPSFAFLTQSCEAYISNDVPLSRYQINDDQTVIDKLTGLMWAQCTVGRSGVDCATGEDSKMNWSDALQTAGDAAYAGYIDWRLPNVEEYRSLVNYSCYSPAIRLDVFPNVQSRNNYYWTSEFSVRYSNNDTSKMFDFLGGIQNANFRTASHKVMLVRTEVE